MNFMRLEISSFSKIYSIQQGDLLLDKERSMISMYKKSYIFDLVEYSPLYEEFFESPYRLRWRIWNREILVNDGDIVGNIKGTKVYSKIFMYSRTMNLQPLTRSLILDTVLNNIIDSSKFFHNETNRSH